MTNIEPANVRGMRSCNCRSAVHPPIPLSLYIHIPWCVRKCPYCDFNSHQVRAEIPERDYVDALIADLDGALPAIAGRQVVSVFVGGGTPSLFSSNSIHAILSAARTRLVLADDAEITLEANPGTVEAGKFAGFRAAGVNRLSLGIQSFDCELLRALGRVHDDVQAKRAIEIAQREFDNLNLDLMYGLPGQTVDSARRDIAIAIAYRPSHISAYQLSLEPNTLFHKYPPTLPDDDATSEMQGAIEAALAASDYHHYETSAFALMGCEARHNLNYWQFGDYVGVGAGAHSKLTTGDGVVRQMRHKQPRAYIEHVLAGAAIQEQHEVPAKELGFEFMMNALRLNRGFAVQLFEQRTGLPLADVQPGLDQGVHRGLLTVDPQWIAPTALGRRFLNDLLQLFLV